MLLEDNFTFRVGCIRPAITSTDKVSRNRAMVVVIDFVHHDGVELAKPFVVVGLQEPCDEGIVGFVVTDGFYRFTLIRHKLRHTHPEVVRLHTAVTTAGGAKGGGVDSWEEPGCWVAFHDVRVDFDVVFELVKITDLNTIDGLVIDAVGFPSNGVLDTSTRHQVAFVGAVDKRFGIHGHPARANHALDHLAFHFDFVDKLCVIDGDLVFHQPLEENALGYVRLELELFRLTVVSPAFAVELTAESSDNGLNSGIGEREPTGCHPADEAAWVYDDDAAPTFPEGDSSDDTRGSCTVDADIRRDDRAAWKWCRWPVVIEVWVHFRLWVLRIHGVFPVVSRLSNAATSLFHCSR